MIHCDHFDPETLFHCMRQCNYFYISSHYPGEYFCRCKDHLLHGYFNKEISESEYLVHKVLES